MSGEITRQVTANSKYKIPDWKKHDPFVGKGDGGADVFYDGCINDRTLIPPGNPAASMTDEDYTARFPGAFVPSWARKYGSVAAVPANKCEKL